LLSIAVTKKKQDNYDYDKYDEDDSDGDDK